MIQTSPERSAVMRAVKSKDTSPERAVRSLLHRAGYRFRLHRRDLPGNPDLVFPSRHKAVFVHGCFWHGHRCKRGNRIPKTNTAYWEEKIARNRARDASHCRDLKKLGWQVCTIWECQLKEPASVLQRLVEFLRDTDGSEQANRS